MEVSSRLENVRTCQEGNGCLWKREELFAERIPGSIWHVFVVAQNPFGKSSLFDPNNSNLEVLLQDWQLNPTLGI